MPKHTPEIANNMLADIRRTEQMRKTRPDWAMGFATAKIEGEKFSLVVARKPSAAKVAIRTYGIAESTAKNVKDEAFGHVWFEAGTVFLALQKGEFTKAKAAIRGYLKQFHKPVPTSIKQAKRLTEEQEAALEKLDEAALSELGKDVADEAVSPTQPMTEGGADSTLERETPEGIAAVSDDPETSEDPADDAEPLDDDDAWDDEEWSAPLTPKAAAQVARIAESLADYIQRVDKGQDAKGIGRDIARKLEGFLEGYLPQGNEVRRDELADNVLLRVLLRARPTSVPDDEEKVLGVALDTVGAAVLSAAEVVTELCRDLERFVDLEFNLKVNADLLKTDRFKAWAERVIEADDRIAETKRIKSTLAKVFVDGKGDATFGIEAARDAREPIRKQASVTLNRIMAAKAAINAAFDGFAATLGTEADAKALAAKGLVMIVPPKAIQKQADRVRQKVVAALDEVASMAMKYPFSREDPLPPIEALKSVAADEGSARADALLSSTEWGAPIKAELASVLEAARLLTPVPAA